MRFFFFTLPFALIAGAATAQDGPNSLTMSCASAQRLVQERGAVVMWSGPDIFDRYVASQVQCEGDQYTVPAWVTTQDQQQCLVGSAANRSRGRCADGSANREPAVSAQRLTACPGHPESEQQG